MKYKSENPFLQIIEEFGNKKITRNKIVIVLCLFGSIFWYNWMAESEGTWLGWVRITEAILGKNGNDIFLSVGVGFLGFLFLWDDGSPRLSERKNPFKKENNKK